jgi:low temperature requirement protein LtrA
MFHFLRIHTVPTEEEGSTWLQLFFDLVYVAILVELGNRLSGDLTLQSTVAFALLFIPIWWSWLEFVSYGRVFPTHDLGQRILTVLYMVVMLLMAFEIHNLTGATATPFILAYALSKFVLSLMYARAWFQYPQYRSLTGHHALAYVIVGLLWIGIALVAPNNLWLWGLATILGVLTPLFIRQFRDLIGHSDQPHPPTKHHYLMRRFGELTIIVLGEFFIKLATSSAGRELELFNLYLGLGLLGISVSLWWLYFDHLEHATLKAAGSSIGLWLYSHYPFLVAITAYGVVGTKIFSVTSAEPIADEKRLLFTIALAIALLAYGAIEYASKEKAGPAARQPQPWLRFGSAAALLALGIWGASLSVTLLVTAVVSILLLNVGLDIYARLRQPAPETALGTHSAAHLGNET